MSVPQASTRPRPRHEDEVELRIPADAEQLPIARTVAASMALEAGFTVERVEEARLLTEELCATLLRHAVDGAVLLCRFRVHGDVLRLHGAMRKTDPVDVDTGSLRWRMLTAVADSVRNWTSSTPETGAEYVHIEAVEAPAGEQEAAGGR